MSRSFGTENAITLWNGISSPAGYNPALPITIAMWVRPTAAYGVACAQIYNYTSGYSLNVVAQQALDTYITADQFETITGESNTGVGPALNVWSHVCGVFASVSSRTVFLNGGNKTTDTTDMTGYATNVSAIKIGAGAFNETQLAYDSDIAEVAYWNVALTDAEVIALAKGANPTKIRPSALFAYYPMRASSAGNTYHEPNFSGSPTAGGTSGGMLMEAIEESDNSSGGTHLGTASHPPVAPPFKSSLRDLRSGIVNVTLNAVGLTSGSPVLPALTPHQVAYLGDYVLDNGLSALHDICDKIVVCSQLPASYAEATTAYILGHKDFGAGNAFAAPSAGSPAGRIATSTAVTDGSVTADGNVAAWAAVDSVNGRLLATGRLTTTAVTDGQGFTLASFSLHLDNQFL